MIQLYTKPLWILLLQRGKHWSYKSPGYCNENISTQNSLTIEKNASQASTPHLTSPPLPPQEKRQPKARKEEIDLVVCQTCHVRYQNPADIETNRLWFNCAKACNWWDPVNQHEVIIAQQKKVYLKKALKRKVNS